jgi:multiple sugar transport system substrate-binding protein
MPATDCALQPMMSLRKSPSKLTDFHLLFSTLPLQTSACTAAFGSTSLVGLAAAATLCLTGGMLAAHAAEPAEPLRVWTRSSNDGRKTYDALAAAFTARSGIRVEYFNATTDFEQRLARAAVGRDLPDVIINDGGSLGQFVGMGIVSPIDRQQIEGGADLHERAWRTATLPDGRVFAVPTSAQAHVLFIRKDWRTKLGLPIPQTWDEVAALARAFTERDPDGNGQADTYGFVFPGGTARGYAAWFISSFLFEAGGDFVRLGPDGRGRGALAEPAAAQTLAFFRRLMCEDKSTQPGAINASTQEANRAFISGQAGIYLSGPYHIALFDKEPGFAKVEVVPAPAGPGGTRATLAGGELAFITKTTLRRADAIRFIEFLISVPGQTLGTRPPPGGLPVVRLPVNRALDAGAAHQDPRWATVADAYLNQGKALPTVPNWARLQQVAADGFNSMLARCSTTIEADLKALNGKIDAELDKQRVLAR